MEAKEKALELINKFKPHSYNGATEEDDERMKNYHAKQIALKTLEEITSFLPFTDLNTSLGKFCEKQRQFLEEIKEEINNYK
jgi:hypothetical protein